MPAAAAAAEETAATTMRRVLKMRALHYQQPATNFGCSVGGNFPTVLRK